MPAQREHKRRDRGGGRTARCRPGRRPRPAGGPAGERGPVLAEAAARRCRGHDHEGPPPPRPDPGESDPEEAISPAKRGPGRRSLVHGELVAQGEILQGELAMTAAEEREESKHVEQEGDHRTESLSRSGPRDQRLGPGRGFGEGQAIVGGPDQAVGATVVDSGHGSSMAGHSRGGFRPGSDLCLPVGSRCPDHDQSAAHD